MKKTFLAAVFAATIAVSGLGSTSAYASVFSDINTVPWPEAAQYIDEAYNLGLMVGYVKMDSATANLIMLLHIVRLYSLCTPL